MAGGSRARTISSNSDLLRQRWLWLALIFGAGMLTVVFHDVFRWPMKMPGRHGLELMALMVFVRCASGERYAASLAAAGGVFAAALVGHGAGVESVILLLQGATIDIGYRRLQRWSWWWLALPLLSGLAHMIKPVAKLGFQRGLGIASDSLAAGLAYPLATHFVFGLVGGLFGAMAWRGLDRARQANNT